MPLTPPEHQMSQDLKDNMSVMRSGMLSEYDPSELMFTQSQHNLNLNNINASTSSTSPMSSTNSVTSSTPLNMNTLGTSIQRRDSTVRLQHRDSGSLTRHTLHHCDSSLRLRSQFTIMCTRIMTGPTNPPANLTIPTTNFGLSQSLNLGMQLVLYLQPFSLPNWEDEVRSMSPVDGYGPSTMSDDVDKSSTKSGHRLHCRGSPCLYSFCVAVLIFHSRLDLRSFGG